MKTASVSRRPTNVLNALRLLVFSLAIELLGFAFSGDYSVGNIIGVLIGAALSFWLLRQVHAGVNWARFTITLIVVLGALALLITFREAYRQHPGATIIDVISTLITFVAVALLFTKESNQWFQRDTVTTRL